jgi:nickel transport protein
MKENRMKLLVGVFALLLFFATAASVLAHAATLWAYVEKNHVYVEAFYVGGTKVQGGRIVVIDSDGKKLLEGKTDEEGKFDFAPPAKVDMKILLLVDQGHSAEFEVKAEDFKADSDC